MKNSHHSHCTLGTQGRDASGNLGVPQTASVEFFTVLIPTQMRIVQVRHVHHSGHNEQPILVVFVCCQAIVTQNHVSLTKDRILGMNRPSPSVAKAPKGRKNENAKNPNIIMKGIQNRDSANAPTDIAAPTATAAIATPITNGPT